MYLLWTAFLVGLVYGQHSQTCGSTSCSSCICDSNSCPIIVEPGQHLAVFRNFSRATSFSGSVEGLAGPPADSLLIYPLSTADYRQWSSGNAYSLLWGTSVSVTTGTCFSRSVDTKGRGFVLAIKCANTDRNCSIWFYVEQKPYNECTPGCPTGAVDDGNCDYPTCTVAACDYDGVDCYIPPPPPPPLPPPPPPAPPSCPTSCTWVIRGDGNCDNQCNYAECDYDQGDCSNPCSPNPCQNGGSCSPISSSTSSFDYKCSCSEGWCGAHCTTSEDYNVYDRSNNEYCKGKLSDCKDSYPESDVYFCCEQLISDTNWTCRLAVSSTVRLGTLFGLLIAIL